MSTRVRVVSDSWFMVMVTLPSGLDNHPGSLQYREPAHRYESTDREDGLLAQPAGQCEAAASGCT